MKNRGLLVASLIVAALMAGLAVYAASLLPAGAQLPTHWGASGKPDRFADALPALLMMPANCSQVKLLSLPSGALAIR